MATGSAGISAVYEALYNPNYMPRSSPRAHIEDVNIDGEPTSILMKESAEEYYEVDPTTHAVWRLLDGRKTVKEIYDELKAKNDKLTEKDVRDTVVSLAQEGLIESTEPELRKKRVMLQSAFQLNIQLVRDSSKTLTSFFRITRRLIRKQELPLCIGIAAVGFVLFFASFVRIFVNPSLLYIAGSAILGFFFYQLVILLPVYAVHELAHAAVCDYYGGRPREIGTGLYYLAPFFYVDTTDAWRLSRRARIMISVAGPLSTVVISSFFVFASYFASGFLRDILQISAFFGFYGSLLNFSPVIESDGYFILSDALNIPDLRDEAFSYLKRAFLTLARRPVRAVRQSARRKRVIAIYTLAAVAWLAFFLYTTAWLMGVYGVSAYLALSALVQTALRQIAFNLTAVGINIATLAYFGLYIAGFVVMGAFAYKKVRMRGVKLETIHDKMVSLFLPFPSDTQDTKSSRLAEASRKLGQGYSRFTTVTLQPPLCVTELRLGRVDQSIESMWEQMNRIEDSFRALHREFLGHSLMSGGSSKVQTAKRTLVELASNFPSSQRQKAVSSVSQFVRMQNDKVDSVLQSAFGTVWTLGLSPDDYGRIRRGMFPRLIAEDLSVTDLPIGVEEFKVQRVVGFDTIARLSSEIEDESKEVYKKPEVYQATVFLEPIKSRLVFVGRTDKVQGSVVWLGGLYLYQAWTSYIGDALDEAALGLKSIRLSRPALLTKTAALKLSDGEPMMLKRSLDLLANLDGTVNEAIGKVESTFETASNFHEMLADLVTDQSFDVGLYKPLLAANEEHLKGVREKIGEFRKEWEWVAKRLVATRDVVVKENDRRATELASRRTLAARVSRSISSLWSNEVARGRTQAYDAEAKLLFATTRLVYGIVIGSDVVL